MSNEFETFASGDPVAYALRGVKELSSRQRRSHDTLKTPIEERYGTSVSRDTARVLEQLHSAKDGMELVEAIQRTGLNEIEDYGALLEGLDVDVNSDEPDIGDVMGLIDQTLSDSLCPRETDASKVTNKRQRQKVYIPELVNNSGDGTVYMAKTLSSTDKVRMAWDLHDDNQVVVVDDYEVWEELLGWEKLKSFPHGKNKIREELGDQLSDEVLEVVASKETASATADSNSNDGPSRGRRTRTKPSEELLNLATSSRNRDRTKMRSKKIAETFDDGESIGYSDIQMLVLFPSTADRNMTDHWWVAGKRWPGGGSVAIANCNKGTFEYLNQYEEVWHIDDYLDQAPDYEFDTSAGPVTMRTVPTDNLVIHTVSDEVQDRLMRENILKNMPQALHTYVEDELYRAPPLPHEDDMIYAPITPEDVFWLRPVLREQTSPDDGDALVATADRTPRDLPKTKSISSDYKLYARARLPNWDFDSPEMKALDKSSGLYLDLEDGGFELLETLGRLHDKGEQPYSDSPQERWA